MNNILYWILISIFLVAIIVKYLCMYVYKCDQQFKHRNIYTV